MPQTNLCGFRATICWAVLFASSTSLSHPRMPIVYTIAGSDSGGGAGIQADLHAIHAMNCHGCSAVTCLTAQNSVGVTSVHTPPVSFLNDQLDALVTDMPPDAIKIGMLGNSEVASTVAALVQRVRENQRNVWVVLDPVMISTSGHKLIDDNATSTVIQEVFPLADLITPNKFEAEALLGRKLNSPSDIEKAGRDLLNLGCKAVLIKGGHTLVERNDDAAESSQVQSTLTYAQDYLISSEQSLPENEQRLCDASRGVWIRTPRWDTENTHGTGCTLSSAIASALALGQTQRDTEPANDGATNAIHLTDACCMAKAYVSAGIRKAVKLGHGPGPVSHTRFPTTHEHFPAIVTDPTKDSTAFLQMSTDSEETRSDVPVLGKILPIVDTPSWLEKLCSTKGITDVQLRIKNESDPGKIKDTVRACQELCKGAGVRLWVNDHWEAAVEAGCFGVHVGQEDLIGMTKKGGLQLLQDRNIALGISTHSYAELAVARGLLPSYISMGPVYATSSKNVKFAPQGLKTVQTWSHLIPPEIPFMTIGGIADASKAAENRLAGAQSVAVIGAVTNADDVQSAVEDLINAMS